MEQERRSVEVITREAFWNLYVPGCVEHYLVHIMREHPDFLGDLDFVALADGQIVGNIMYTKSRLVGLEGTTLEIATFGPVSVVPEFQKRGIGASLISHSLERASAMGIPAVVIYGSPHHYCRHGFKSARDFNIANEQGKHPYAMLALELKKDALNSKSWTYMESPVFNFNPEAADTFDASFPYKERSPSWTQVEFSMSCRAFIE